MTPNTLRSSIALIALLAACSAAAQQLYRWTDEKGRTHVTDTPPPASAKSVQKKSAGTGSGADAVGEVPFELSLAMKDFPVVLYTAPGCKQVCGDARSLLNKRGVPFKEVQVWDEESGNELTKVAGSVFIPTLVVGRSVQKGYTADSFNALLDSARYPKAGVVAARSQAAPPLPKGYTDAKEETAKAEPVKPEAEEPKGPYSPGAKPPVRPTPKK
jgi:glutaredoxin